MKALPATLLCLILAIAPASASTIEFDGRQRSFEMYVPAANPRPLPVVLVLHGGGGTTDQMRRYTGFDRVAQREGVLAVYPQAVAGHWNDGRAEIANMNARSAETDDVAFLIALVDTLARTGLADTNRVFVAGISNGGMMAMRLACELPQRVSGIAVVAANLPKGLDCVPPLPVPAVFFHGTGDKFMPFADGDVLQWANIDRGKVLSARETVETWRQLDGCSGEPKESSLSERKGLTTERLSFEPCDGAPVVQYITTGGGHAWPGAPQGPGGDAILGPNDKDVDASEVIWAFFKGLPGR